MLYLCLFALVVLLAGGGFWVSGKYSVLATRFHVTHNHCQNSDADAVIMGGGGLVQEDAHFACHECVFDHNTADKGGGLMVLSRRTMVEINSSSFVLNHALVGGAVAQERAGSSTYTSCIFFGNSVTSSGGAMHSMSSGQLIFSQCTFYNCSATGELSFGGTLTVDEGVDYKQQYQGKLCWIWRRGVHHGHTLSFGAQQFDRLPSASPRGRRRSDLLLPPVHPSCGAQVVLGPPVRRRRVRLRHLHGGHLRHQV